MTWRSIVEYGLQHDPAWLGRSELSRFRAEAAPATPRLTGYVSW
jgi:hypothetical protein